MLQMPVWKEGLVNSKGGRIFILLARAAGEDGAADAVFLRTSSHISTYKR